MVALSILVLVLGLAGCTGEESPTASSGPPSSPTATFCDAYVEVAIRERAAAAEFQAIDDDLLAGRIQRDEADARLVEVGHAVEQRWHRRESAMYDVLADSAPDDLADDVGVLRSVASRWVEIGSSADSMVELHERLDDAFAPSLRSRHREALRRIEDHVLSECGPEVLDLVR